MRRLLLPFTHGIDGTAIEYALIFARQTQSTLVVGSWLAHPTLGKPGRPLLGHIEQSKDFLALTGYKAKRFHVPVEPVELYSVDSAKSMQVLAREMDCDAILLFMRKDKVLLISKEEMQQLLRNSHTPLLIVRLPGRYPAWQKFKAWSIAWLQRMHRSTRERPVLMPHSY
ncbi:universal stress protein [Dictyobacter kobayashii]|uniref:UspA domain-containing protein n=1 Tax=Dictyobacter kobayashii TaxID=2014872 RepID=A0A402AB45_9CHLR|nr:universal stress protein [Dictyobacter kobayashii]GCE16340.1 hypothetical protein KDK_01400 [Dictyobacter kobayashii]